MADETDRSLSELTRLSTEDLARWLRAVVTGRDCEPSLSHGPDDVHIALIDLRRRMDLAVRDRFDNALIAVFRTLQPQPDEAEALFYVLHLLSNINPLGAQSIMRQRLSSRAFAELSYGKQNLHTLLLSACSADVDAQLVSLVYATAEHAHSFKELLVCLRTLSKTGGTDALRFLPRLLPLLDSPVREVQLARQLTDVIFRVGWEQLYVWYANDFEIVSFRERLDRILREGVILWPDECERVDDHRLLLAAWLHAGYRAFVAGDVLRVAKLVISIPEDDVRKALNIMWLQSIEKWPNDYPWTVRLTHNASGTRLELTCPADRTRLMPETVGDQSPLYRLLREPSQKVRGRRPNTYA